ncbi:MAG: aspartate kinase [Acidobacteriota bacterium]
MRWRVEMRAGQAGVSVVVWKFGGSVLTSPAAYRRCARAVGTHLAARPRERIVAVVSALRGETDRLLSQAKWFGATPDPAALDLLWSTGETRSAALLALAIRQRGVPADSLAIHEAGLRATARGLRLRVDARRLLARLSAVRVVVVPGFLALDRRGRIVSLGRGGSDLTAVAVAAALRARQCDLIKDVPGVFDADPGRTPSARRFDTVAVGDLLALADGGARIVQADALRLASRTCLPIVVRAIDIRRGATRIETDVSAPARCA